MARGGGSLAAPFGRLRAARDIERRRTALNIDLGRLPLEPIKRGRDEVVAGGERIEHVSAVIVP